MGVEALVNWVFLDIQRTILDAPTTIAEPRLRLGKEARGNIRVHVVEPPVGKLRQHRRGR